MDTNRHELSEPLLEKDLVYRIVGCAFEVLREIGPGLHEKIYENALVLALDDAGIAVQQQEAFPVLYKGREVGEFIPDLIAERRVVIDTKVIDHITDHERGKMLNYLIITGLRVGVILNFKRAKLEWDRVVR
jgi:GxxExxY protein